MMTLDLIYGDVDFGSLCFYRGKFSKSGFLRNYYSDWNIIIDICSHLSECRRSEAAKVKFRILLPLLKMNITLNLK